MNKKDVLEKAIQKAIAGGWDKKGYGTAVVSTANYIFFHNECEEHGPENFSKDYSPEEVIFNHDFAKALWGEGEMKDCKYPDCDETCLAMWQYHLQQMVIADDPIQYLGDNI
jgi:hypothetical protein